MAIWASEEVGTASDIKISNVGFPTYKTLQDWMNTTQSSGLLSGGHVTDNGDGSVTVAAGTGMIKATSDVLSETGFFDWEEEDNLVLIDSGSINWIYVDYAASVVSVKTTDNFESMNWATQFIIAVAYRSGTDICVQDLGSRRFNLANRVALREYDLWGYTRSDGLVLSETGTLNAYMTSGHYYALYTKVAIPIIDTSGTDRICYWYRDGVGGWTRQSDITTFNNTKYDNNSGVLQDLGVTKYNTVWCFLSLDGKLNFIYGRLNTGVLATAEAEKLYPDLPDFINSFAFLIAKVIVQQGNSSVVEVESAFETVFQASTPTSHNGLAGLNIGDYQHLTAAEKTKFDDIDANTLEVMAPVTNPLALSQGVHLTAATSGSNGIQVANNADINFGTGDFTLVWKGSSPDWGVITVFISDRIAGGFIFDIGTNGSGIVRLVLDTSLDGGSTKWVDFTSAVSQLNNSETYMFAVTLKRSAGDSTDVATLYLNGLQYGDPVQLPSDFYKSIDNSNPTYVSGTNTIRYASTTLAAYTYNYALDADQVKDLYNNGVAFADKDGSQTAITSGTLVYDKNYIIDTFVAGDDFTNVGAASNASGVKFTATGTTPTTWTNGSSLRRIGTTLRLEPENAQPSPGQWLDAANGHHAKLPAVGASLIRPKNEFEIRWANTWAGTHEAQYIGGINEAILPANAYIESIIGTISGTTIEDIIIGDGSDVDRFVEITTGLAAGTTSFTIANPTTDGTNFKLVVDPDANFTGSIVWTIKGMILEA